MSKYNFPDLCDDVRELMLNEVQHDISKRVFYYTTRFNENGRKAYVPLLKEAISSGDENSLQLGLQQGENFNKYEAQGKKVSVNAPGAFAQTEFNKFYIRAICVKSIELGKPVVEVYRAHALNVKKHKSDLRIGVNINAEKLLKDMRNNTNTPSMVLPELVSGLSVKLKEDIIEVMIPEPAELVGSEV